MAKKGAKKVGRKVEGWTRATYIGAFGDITLQVATANLLEWSPFKCLVWHMDLTRPLKRWEVTKALRENRLRASPDWESSIFTKMHTRLDHAGRIAWFVRHGMGDEPVAFDAGEWVRAQWPITDGNHRLGAAIYSKLPTISVHVSGRTEEVHMALMEELKKKER